MAKPMRMFTPNTNFNSPPLLRKIKRWLKIVILMKCEEGISVKIHSSQRMNVTINVGQNYWIVKGIYKQHP